MYCTEDGVELYRCNDNVEFKLKSQEAVVALFPVLTKEYLPPNLNCKVNEKVWDFSGKDIGLILKCRAKKNHSETYFRVSLNLLMHPHS